MNNIFNGKGTRVHGTLSIRMNHTYPELIVTPRVANHTHNPLSYSPRGTRYYEYNQQRREGGREGGRVRRGSGQGEGGSGQHNQCYNNIPIGVPSGLGCLSEAAVQVSFNIMGAQPIQSQFNTCQTHSYSPPPPPPKTY